MLRYLIALMLVASMAAAGDITLNVTATTNQTANIKMLFKEGAGSYPDTATISWGSGATNHSGDHNSGIAAAVADADSGGINISWTAATGHDGYRLDFNPNDEGWATASFIHVDSTTFGHDIGSTAEPRRGEINYRLRSFAVDGDTTWSSVALITDLFYNQAKRIYTTFHASNGATIVESTEGSALYISYPGSDTTPPDAPAGLVATAGDGSVGLDWDDNSEGDLDDYTVYRGTVSGTRPLLQAGVAASNYTDNTAVNGTEYFYSVTATDNSANESGHSSEVSATPAASGGGGTYDVASAFVYVHTNTSASNVRVVIYDDAKDLVASSPSSAISGTGDWMELSWASGPTLVSGSAYYLCVVADGAWEVGAIAGDVITHDSSGSFASPPDPWNGTYKTGGVLSVYIVNGSSDVLLGVNTRSGQISAVDGEVLGNYDLDQPAHTVPTL